MSQRNGDLDGGTPIADLFKRCTEGSDTMDRKSFDRWVAQSGYSSYLLPWLAQHYTDGVQVLLPRTAHTRCV